MPDFYPVYEMNADGTYKLDSEGKRITTSVPTGRRALQQLEPACNLTQINRAYAGLSSPDVLSLRSLSLKG